MTQSTQKFTFRKLTGNKIHCITNTWHSPKSPLFCEKLCYHYLKHSKSASRSVVSNGKIVPRRVCGHLLKPRLKRNMFFRNAHSQRARVHARVPCASLGHAVRLQVSLLSLSVSLSSLSLSLSLSCRLALCPSV